MDDEGEGRGEVRSSLNGDASFGGNVVLKVSRSVRTSLASCYLAFNVDATTLAVGRAAHLYRYSVIVIHWTCGSCYATVLIHNAYATALLLLRLCFNLLHLYSNQSCSV